MKKRFIAGLLTFIMLLALISPLSAQAATGWQKDSNGYWYYYLSDTAYYRDTVQWIDDGYYFFYPDGKMGTGWCLQEYTYAGTYYRYWFYATSSGRLLSGWQWLDGAWYYFDASQHCVMYSDRSALINGNYYYFAKGGAMMTGWILNEYTDSEGNHYTDWYYADSSGALVTGWRYINGYWYYFDDGYHMYSNRIAQINGSYYFFYPSGAMGIGWCHREFTDSYGTKYSDWYYANPDGALAKGWKWINGAWYYFYQDSTPFMFTGANKIGGTWYILQNSGALVSWNGWVKYYTRDGTIQWYYSDKDGHPAIGWKWINGAWYYFYLNGVMAQNTIEYINGKKYVFSDSGALIESAGWKKLFDKSGNPRWVYIESDGTVATGWRTIDGVKYYLNPNDGGFMVSDAIVIDSRLNLFESNGKHIGIAMDSKWYYFNGKYFYVKPDGFAALGFYDVDGATYYFNTYSGVMFADDIIEIDGNTYYFHPSGAIGKGWISNKYGEKYYANSSGVLQTKWQYIGGKKYYFDPINYYMYYGGIYNIDGTQYSFTNEGVCIEG